MFRFRFVLLSSLPRLAWCACVTQGHDEIVVEHGSWVETRPTFFAEGAWDAPFDLGAIDEARIVLGSGGCIRATGAIFSTTTHTMERLQSVRVGARLFISNSFAYLLAATGDAADPNYRYYERDFMSFLRGRQDATREVPVESGRTVRLHYGERISVTPDLAASTQAFPLSAHFACYEDYIANVASIIARLHANASAPSRHVRYAPLSTLSSGYDSPACTVLAKQIGCHEAISIADARTDDPPEGHAPSDPSDTGADIARHLQIDLTLIRRESYLDRNDCPEAEFIATGNGGDSVVFCGAESSIAGKMFFTGFLGDTLWGMHALSSADSRGYVFKFPAGGSFGEFRLRTGFIHVPVPLLTYSSQPDLVRISQSVDMAAWRVGGTYDRPIPRRLVEGAGVPRSIYALEKKAVSQPLWLPTNRARIRAMMSRASWESLTQYAASRDVSSRLSLSSRWKTAAARVTMLAASPTLNWQVQKLGHLAGIKRMPRLEVSRFSTSAGFSLPAGLKFHWAISQIASRYRQTQLTPTAR